MDELNNINSQYLVDLLEKQVKKIISENDVRDPYFTIRSNFDIDQSVWDIAVHVYKSTGYQIDLLKTKQLILEKQSLAWQLYEHEQLKLKLEQERIKKLEEQEKLRLEKERFENIQRDVLELEKEYKNLSGKLSIKKKALEKIFLLKQQNLSILKQQKESLLQQLEEAERNYDLNKAANLRYGKLEVLEKEIETKEKQIIELTGKIKLLEKPVMEDIKPLVESLPNSENSTLKAKIFLCLTKIIQEDIDDVSQITWETNLLEYFESHNTYPQTYTNSSGYSSGSLSSGSSNWGFSFLDTSQTEFIVSLEELLDLEISDEEQDKYLVKLENFIDYIISQFQNNVDILEKCITDYLLDTI